MKIRGSALVAVCVFGMHGEAATAQGSRAGASNVKVQSPPHVSTPRPPAGSPKPAPMNAQKPAQTGHRDPVSARPTVAVRKPHVERPAVRPASGLHWRCEHAGPIRRFRAAHGLICWDGLIYNTYDGGVPPYMLDYFEKNPRNLDEGYSRELVSASLADPENEVPGRPAAYALATVAPAAALPKAQ